MSQGWPAKFIMILGLAAAGPADAVQSGRTLPPTLVAIEACRALADSALRLACFDVSTKRLVEAERTGDVSVVDRSQLRRARRSLFGLSMPKLPFFAGDRSAEDDKDELDSTITSAQQIGYGKYQLVIADGGATWRTTEAFTTMRDPKKGDKIVIKRGPLGSYMLRISGQRGVKGIRVH